MSDITSREDLEILLSTFYSKLLADERIAFIFTDIAKINLEEHLPTIVDFWETALLGAPRYRGNPMGVHFDLHEKSPLTKQHFTVWLNYWDETVEELFEGPVAKEARSRARSIAFLMQHKLEQTYGPLSSI